MAHQNNTNVRFLSVCLSVIRRHCVETAEPEPTIIGFSLYGSLRTVVLATLEPYLVAGSHYQDCVICTH